MIKKELIDFSIVTKSFSKQKTQVKMPEEEPMQTGIRVFISGNSGNKEVGYN